VTLNLCLTGDSLPLNAKQARRILQICFLGSEQDFDLGGLARRE
jgi:hypothetical protein